MVLLVVEGNSSVVAGDVGESWKTSYEEKGSGGVAIVDVLDEVIDCWYAKQKFFMLFFYSFHKLNINII